MEECIIKSEAENLSKMNTLYITNKTDKPMQATICDSNTGNDVLIYELRPGNNEITVNALQNGVYMIRLADANNDIFLPAEADQRINQSSNARKPLIRLFHCTSDKPARAPNATSVLRALSSVLPVSLLGTSFLP